MKMMDFFIGKWSFTRGIWLGDFKDLHASANGKCDFEQDEEPGKLIYHERGKMVLEANKLILPFSRSYRYDFLQEDKVNVSFNDGPDIGRLYQSYSFKEDSLELQPEAVHLCGNDSYNGSYQFLDDDSFMGTTSIKGISKDFSIKTIFTRYI